MCVSVQPLQPSGVRGKALSWSVTAWAVGGAVPNAVVSLRTTPDGSGAATFSFGCGNDDGTPGCALGALDPGAAQRQLQAEVTVPLDVATVASVSLTATGNATGLAVDPAASGTVSVLAPAIPIAVTATLPALSPPGVGAPTPTLSPGGNAGGLFPSLSPEATTPVAGAPGAGGTQEVAETSALTGRSSNLGPEVVGLVALTLAFVFAVTRVSVRRPASATPAPEPAPMAAEPAVRAEAEDDYPDYPEEIYSKEDEEPDQDPPGDPRA